MDTQERISGAQRAGDVELLDGPDDDGGRDDLASGGREETGDGDQAVGEGGATMSGSEQLRLVDGDCVCVGLVEYSEAEEDVGDVVAEDQGKARTFTRCGRGVAQLRRAAAAFAECRATVLALCWHLPDGCK